MEPDKTSIFNWLVQNAHGEASRGPQLIRPKAPPLPRMLLPEGGSLPAPIANPGLWWERYGEDMVEMVRKKIDGNWRDLGYKFDIAKKDWVDQLVKVSDGQKPDPVALEAHAGRLKAIAESGVPRGLTLDMTLTTRLVTGMGLPHPVENSLVFHPTLGCPYIPGSSIKGAVQAFADEWLAGEGYDHVPDDLREVMTRIFGQASRKKNADQATALGSVIFFDAIPLTPPKIVAEVMTPHVGGYLTGSSDLPLETTNPKPIYFPAVDPGGKGKETVFRFCLRPSVRAQAAMDDDTCASDVKLAAGWLVACLRDVGIGAKTKSGYGRFRQQA